MPLRATILLATLVAAPAASAQNVRIGVLGLFRPQELTVRAPEGGALSVRAGEKSLVLESSSGTGVTHIRRAGSALVFQAGAEAFTANDLLVSGRNGNSANIVLEVPGKISRQYVGTLQVKAASGALIAIVSMDLEAAVASVVAAETTADTPLEAMQAQAVAARSYFVASEGRHHEFDFCDTTHCQFLREPPAAAQRAARAAAETRGMVLAYESRPFAAMYTRSCSGRTRTPAEIGLPDASYPYYSVDCRFCRENPVRWQSRVPAEDAASLRGNDEKARLTLSRRMGWNTIPSNDFAMAHDGNGVILRGTGQGHGIGLCQAGARAMAREGASFREILAYYYPNTTILNIPREQAPTIPAYPGYQTLRGSAASRR